jgi:hypothetical protein
MINYYLRSDGAITKIDGDNQNVTTIVNTNNQKIISYITENTNYYNRISEDVVKLNWPLSTELDFNNNKTEVLNYLNGLN